MKAIKEKVNIFASCDEWTPGDFGRINNFIVSKVHSRLYSMCKARVGFLDKEAVLSSDDE